MSDCTVIEQLRVAMHRLVAIARPIVKAPAPSPKPVLLPATAAWLANMRAEAEAPRALIVIVQGPCGSVAIFPEQIVGKSDEELLAFLAKRLEE